MRTAQNFSRRFHRALTVERENRRAAASSFKPDPQPPRPLPKGRQLSMSLDALLAACGDELGAIGRIGLDQLLLLGNLRFVTRDELFLLKFHADTLTDERNGLSLASTSKPMPRRALLE